jgi:D-alanyl-D-alanine carboxypeptidase (penicillin-binding protein 5/6)
MPDVMRYDSAREVHFPVTSRKSETLFNQNELLAKYPGGIGGKIGWTGGAEATYIGMARRNGVTLIVTILHCTPLTEVIYASKLLNWGFAQDGRARPIGTLVSPIAAAPATPAASPRPTAAQRPVTSGTITGPKIPRGLAAASIALIIFAAAAAIVLILLRRRSPSR